MTVCCFMVSCVLDFFCYSLVIGQIIVDLNFKNVTCYQRILEVLVSRFLQTACLHSLV